MTTLPAFGVRLRRLAELRGLTVAALAERAATTEAELAAIMNGGEPGPAVLRALAPALGLHRSDLFIIAGRPVPGDLAPRDPGAEFVINSLPWSLTYLPCSAVPELHRLVRSLPEEPSPPGTPRPNPKPWYQHYPDGPGGLVVRLLHNRNIGWTGAAKYAFGLGRGLALSASTIGMIARAEKALTPELLGGFAPVLDISAADLSAVTGVDRPDTRPSICAHRAEAAALLWSARRLTTGQLAQVEQRARDLKASAE